MPIETYKDPQTGEERRRWVAPQATAPKPATPKPQAAKPAAPKPAAKPKDDGFGLDDLARGAAKLLTPLAQQLPPNKLIEEAVKAGPAIQGAYESLGRTTLSGARQLVQEGYDYVNDELSKVGLTTATTAEKPDAPLPGLGAPLPKVEGLSKGEEIVGNVLALGAGFLATRGAMGRVGGALTRTRVGAPVAQQAAKVTGKVSALRNTPIPAAGQPGRAAAIGKKAAGLVIEEGSQGAVAGALTAYVLEDPWSGNLSNALKGTPLESPFSRWTQTGPGDSSQEARFKNAAADFVYGIPFGIGLGAAGDAIKAATTKVITKTVKVAVAEEAATRAAAEGVPQPVRQVEPQGTVDISQPIRDPEGRVEPTVDPVEKARVELEDAQRELQELAAREMEPPAPPAAAARVDRGPQPTFEQLVKNAPPGEPDPEAWARRMTAEYWSAPPAAAVVDAPTTVVEAPAAAPVKLYRGTKAGSEGSPTVGDGFFMTPDRKVAEAYAGKGGNVTEQDVSFGNLLEAPTWMKAKQQLGLAKSATMDDLIRAARDAGYDGLSFTTKNGKEYVQIPGAAVVDAPTTVVEAPAGVSDEAIAALEKAYPYRKYRGQTPADVAEERLYRVQQLQQTTADELEKLKAAGPEASDSATVAKKNKRDWDRNIAKLTKQAAQVENDLVVAQAVLDRAKGTVDAPTAAAAEPSVPSAGTPEPAAPRVDPAQAAETKALLDRALANLPSEKRAEVQARLEGRAMDGDGTLASTTEVDVSPGLAPMPPAPVEWRRMDMKGVNARVQEIAAKYPTPLTEDEKAFLKYANWRRQGSPTPLDPEFVQSFTSALAEDIRRVAGDDVAIRFQQAFVMRPRTKQWGGSGDPKDLMYVGGSYDPIGDLIQLNGLGTRNITGQEQTAFHEAFHRVQFNFLTEKELKALNSFWSQMKLGIGADDKIKAAAKKDGKIALIEQQAVAFQRYAYARKQGIDPVAYLQGTPEADLKGYKMTDDGIDYMSDDEKRVTSVVTTGLRILDTLLDFIEKTNNFIRGRGWTSINSIFDQAYSGKLAETRADLGNAYEVGGARADIIEGVTDRDMIPLGGENNPYRGRLFSEADDVPEVRPAVEPPDPEDFARRINENIDAIRSGDMDLQEAMSGNVRRYISRSGKTVYRPSAPEEMIATNKALSDMLTSRADATGIASYSVEDVYQEAARRLNRDGLNVELTIQRMEAARAGDPRSQEDLVAQAALILHRDDMAQQNGIAAIEFQNNVDEGVKADAMRRLWAGYEDQLKLDGALMAATRKDAQRLRLNQGPDRVRIAGEATPAPDLPDQTVQQIADQEIANPANSLMDKLDPEIRADIENGVLGPDAEAMTDLLSRVVITSRDTKGVGPRFAAKMKEVPTGRLTQDFILQAYRSSLLYSMKTMMKMTLGSSYRVMTLGASQAFGALGDAALQGVRGNARGTANALRRAGLDMGIYLRMMSELPHALRLAGHAIKEGESFGNLGRNQMEMAQRGFTEADQAVLDAPEFAENVTRETTLNNPFFLDPENKNATAQFMRKAWQTYSFSGRVAGSLDTFFSSLVGPSAEWARLMDLQLRQAEDLGMNPMKAWSWATDKTEELLDAQWAKVVTQGGSVIENGALTGKHAQTVMDWTNFTDPLDIKFQDRSYEYGIRVAKDEGLTDPAEIAARAQEWVNETPDAWKRAGMGVGNVVGLAPKLFQEAVNNVPVLGMLQAFNRGPTNIVKAGMRATGFAAPLADTFWRDINSEDIFTRDRAIGEIATGWLTAVTAVTLATSGFVQLSGPGSLNPQVRQKMRNEGTRPFAIRFRNPTTDEWSAWWDLSPFDSVATIFAGVATYMDTANNMPTENREAIANSLTLTIAETVRQVGAGQFTKGMYGGIMDIFDMFSDLETKSFIPVEGQIGAFEEFIQKKLTGFMPATFRNIRRGQDPYERVIAPGDWPFPFNGLQELGYRFMNEIPGLSENLPPRLHPITANPVVGEQVWGINFIPPEQPWMRGLVQSFSPTAGMPFTMGSVDPVDNELKNLSGRGTAFIVWNANEFQIPNYRLDINRLNRLAEITRDYVPPGRTTTLHGELTALITSAEYQALPEATPSRATESARAIQINKVINYYKGFIKQEFRAQDPDVDARLARIEKQKLMNQNDAQMGIEAWTRRYTR